MPNQPKTPLLAVRVPTPKQDRLRALAVRQGRTVTDLVNEAIDDYLAKWGLSAGV
jgi:predicted DNA-binding protein